MVNFKTSSWFVANNIWCDSGDVTVDYWKWGK